MENDNDTLFPDSPMEMASWVRDRSMKVVRDLARVISFLKSEVEVPDDLQANLHFPLSGALANAIKLAAFSTGHHLTADELSGLVGVIYEKGPSGYDELVVRFASLDDPLTRRLDPTTNQ